MNLQDHIKELEDQRKKMFELIYASAHPTCSAVQLEFDFVQEVDKQSAERRTHYL